MVASRGSSTHSSGIIDLSEAKVSASAMRTIPMSPPLEQTELLPAALGPGEMIRGQFRSPLVEPELLAGDLEPASDHPGHRPGALHPRSPLRIIIAPAAHVADQREDVAIALRIIRHQPFSEQV